MFGAQDSGDTSGYGGLKVRRPLPLPAQRPYGSYFDELADELSGALEQSGSSFGDAVERVATGELSREVAEELAEAGALVIDLAAAGHEDAPLLLGAGTLAFSYLLLSGTEEAMFLTLGIVVAFTALTYRRLGQEHEPRLARVAFPRAAGGPDPGLRRGRR